MLWPHASMIVVITPMCVARAYASRDGTVYSSSRGRSRSASGANAGPSALAAASMSSPMVSDSRIAWSMGDSRAMCGVPASPSESEFASWAMDSRLRMSSQHTPNIS
eukprot:Amastigsp_a5949_40.p3 type:complete len:107 gc:universal Amastigsp_a5949_40:561-241(-)